MDIENDRKTPYTKSLLSLMETINVNLKHLNKKTKMAKIRSIIIMFSTLIMSFTIFQPILPLALIISCFIDLFESVRLKHKLDIINRHEKADISINKFLKLEIELDKKKKFVGNTIELFQSRMKTLIDLYNCFDTDNVEFLENITKKYDQKYEEDLIILKQLNKKDNKQENICFNKFNYIKSTYITENNHIKKIQMEGNM